MANPVLSLVSASASAVVMNVAPPADGTATYTYQLQRAAETVPGNNTAGSYTNTGSAVAGKPGSWTFTDATVVAGTRYYWKVGCTDSASTPVVTTSNAVTTLAGKHSFAGLAAQVDAANTATHSLSADKVAKAKRLVGAAQAIVSKVVDGPLTSGHQAAVIAEATAQRDIHMLAVDAIERGILEVEGAYGITLSTFAKNANQS